MSQNINVLLRVRPLIKTESSFCWDVQDNSIQLLPSFITQPGNSQQFEFSTIYGEMSTNTEIYDKSITDFTKKLVDGFNCTVMAYGQSSSGKTTTMMYGPQGQPGIVFLIMQSLFQIVSQTNHRIKCQFIEIYNENVTDLLSNNKTQVQIREDQNQIYLQNATEQYVQNLSAFSQLLELGQQHRTISETNLNEQSSRSHAVLRLTLEHGDQLNLPKQKQGFKIQKLNSFTLVDLAGSEKLTKTQVQGLKLKESNAINQSLLTLGLVINQLATKQQFVNYRDSKLTRILQNSLGGNALTCIIGCITPASAHLEESVNTMRFLQRAMKICNKAKQSEVLDEKVKTEQLLIQNRNLKNRIQELEQQLNNASNISNMSQQYSSMITVTEDVDALNASISALLGDEMIKCNAEVQVSIENDNNKIQLENTQVNELKISQQQIEIEKLNLNIEQQKLDQLNFKNQVTQQHDQAMTDLRQQMQLEMQQIEIEKQKQIDELILHQFELEQQINDAPEVQSIDVQVAPQMKSNEAATSVIVNQSCSVLTDPVNKSAYAKSVIATEKMEDKNTSVNVCAVGQDQTLQTSKLDKSQLQQTSTIAQANKSVNNEIPNKSQCINTSQVANQSGVAQTSQLECKSKSLNTSQVTKSQVQVQTSQIQLLDQSVAMPGSSVNAIQTSEINYQDAIIGKSLLKSKNFQTSYVKNQSVNLQNSDQFEAKNVGTSQIVNNNQNLQTTNMQQSCGVNPKSVSIMDKSVYAKQQVDKSANVHFGSTKLMHQQQIPELSPIVQQHSEYEDDDRSEDKKSSSNKHASISESPDSDEFNTMEKVMQKRQELSQSVHPSPLKKVKFVGSDYDDDSSRSAQCSPQHQQVFRSKFSQNSKSPNAPLEESLQKTKSVSQQETKEIQLISAQSSTKISLQNSQQLNINQLNMENTQLYAINKIDRSCQLDLAVSGQMQTSQKQQQSFGIQMDQNPVKKMQTVSFVGENKMVQNSMNKSQSMQCAPIEQSYKSIEVQIHFDNKSVEAQRNSYFLDDIGIQQNQQNSSNFVQTEQVILNDKEVQNKSRYDKQDQISINQQDNSMQAVKSMCDKNLSIRKYETQEMNMQTQEYPAQQTNFSPQQKYLQNVSIQNIDTNQHQNIQTDQAQQVNKSMQCSSISVADFQDQSIYKQDCNVQKEYRVVDNEMQCSYHFCSFGCQCEQTEKCDKELQISTDEINELNKSIDLSLQNTQNQTQLVLKDICSLLKQCQLSQQNSYFSKQQLSTLVNQLQQVNNQQKLLEDIKDTEEVMKVQQDQIGELQIRNQQVQSELSALRSQFEMEQRNFQQAQQVNDLKIQQLTYQYNEIDIINNEVSANNECLKSECLSLQAQVNVYKESEEHFSKSMQTSQAAIDLIATTATEQTTSNDQNGNSFEVKYNELQQKFDRLLQQSRETIAKIVDQAKKREQTITQQAQDRIKQLLKYEQIVLKMQMKAQNQQGQIQITKQE